VRYLVVGADGQLGRDLSPRLEGDVVSAGRQRMDLLRPDSLQATLDEVRPNVVINCAAYNFVDKAECEPEAALAVNAFGARNLARLCAQRDCTLVHFSTDYVFGVDSNRATPWREGDPPGPLSVYGTSKLAGEYFVRALCPMHVIIRTCGLYGVWGSGGKGGNFVETMLRLAAHGKPLRVVADQRCTPTYTVDLADAVVALLAAGEHGLFHVTSSGACSWHEFASTILRLFGLSLEVQPITGVEFGAAALRPAYSVLSSDALTRLGVPTPRPWQEALGAYLHERKQRIV
jgi:dTDP-4-dehydrorhamnose reductase